MSAERTIYTVGYSTHELANFLALLRQHAITAVADVRSHPAARLEQYRQANLRAHLTAADLAYVFLGKELGARRDEPECYVDDCAVYDQVARLPAFLEGIARLERGVEQHQIALMCAERDPLDCHRGVLIARELAERGWRVRHILVDGQIEEHIETERRMIDAMGLDPLFDSGPSNDEIRQRAYAERGAELAYCRE